jgi:hypothetical protein
MKCRHLKTWVKSLRQSEPSLSPRRCRRTMPGVEPMEGRVSLSALPAVQRAIPAFNPQPDPQSRWHAAQVSRVGLIGLMPAVPPGPCAGRVQGPGAATGLIGLTQAAAVRGYSDPNE